MMDIEIDDLCNGFVISDKQAYDIGYKFRGLGLWKHHISGDRWVFRFYLTNMN